MLSKKRLLHFVFLAVVIFLEGCTPSTQNQIPPTPTEVERGLAAKTIAFNWSGDNAIDCGSDTPTPDNDIYLLIDACVENAFLQHQPFRKFNFHGDAGMTIYYWIVGNAEGKIHIIDYQYRDHLGWLAPTITLCEFPKILTENENLILSCSDD
jgi:hypothetical protein